MAKSKLAKAIEAGVRDAEKEATSAARLAASKRAKERAKSEALFQKYKAALGDGKALYALIRKRAKEKARVEATWPSREPGWKQDRRLSYEDCEALVGEKYCSGSPELARALETFMGVHALYTTGEDYINSDEVKETWHSVEVWWDEMSSTFGAWLS